MTSLIRAIALLGAWGLTVSGGAFADVPVPDPNLSICPMGTLDDERQAWIGLVGTSGGVPDPRGRHTIVVRDFRGNRMAHVHVTIDFSECVDTGVCEPISGVTNVLGEFTFDALGQGANQGSTVVPPAHHPARTTLPCAKVIADFVTICVAKVNALDQNGLLPLGDGVSGVDAALVLGSVLAVRAGAPYKPLFDINRDGRATGVDAAVELGALLAGRSSSGCPASHSPN